MVNWQSIATAPKDGTPFWGWLYDTGIVLMRWMTAQEAAEVEGGEPEDFEAGWIKAGDVNDSYYKPKYWQPLYAIGVPDGVAWVIDGNEGCWCDVEAATSSATPNAG